MEEQEIRSRLVNMSREEKIKYLEEWEFSLEVCDYISNWSIYLLLGKMIKQLKGIKE